jgi:hypothetical protein
MGLAGLRGTVSGDNDMRTLYTGTLGGSSVTDGMRCRMRTEDHQNAPMRSIRRNLQHNLCCRWCSRHGTFDGGAPRG